MYIYLYHRARVRAAYGTRHDVVDAQMRARARVREDILPRRLAARYGD